MRARIAAVGAMLLVVASGCSWFKDDAPHLARGIGDAIVDAAHAHVHVKVPDIHSPVDLGSLRLDALQAQLRKVFGTDETKQNVDIACRAKDVFVLQTGTTTQAAVREVLASLNLTRPDEDVAKLARITDNALVASADPHALVRAAVTWACDWAGS